jgi:hypothetical protein
MFTEYTNIASTVSTAVVEPQIDTAPTADMQKIAKSKRRLKYGTGILVKRVVLLDGQPVGRGKPAKGTLKNRTVVYIPVDATYNVETYGTGAPYNAYRPSDAIKTINRETYFAKYPKAQPVTA